ncbi:thioredoxin domain-containing protein [Sphingomonas sp.]|uniref:thioredoxin domain-containing protein n=1 Tax=Sphingomonas sp. TaxID=28214 RepID=UPI003B000A64
MRFLLALSALLLLAAAAPRQGLDWTTQAQPTATGYLIGNPNARVKLVEYGSYTCSHCAAFANESEAELKGRMIRTGSISLEYRHFFFNALDLGVAVLARCTGPRRFAATTAFIYRTQDDWLARGQQFQETNGARLNMYLPIARLRALVDGSGLTAAVVARGLTPAAVDACFADQAAIDRLTAGMNALPAGVTGTPTFFLNGRLIAHVTWADLAPQLRAALAR